MNKNYAVLIVWMVTFVVLQVLNVADWIIYGILLVAAMVAIIDYYWLDGKLSGRSYKNGKR